jgi:hypothetical protein
MNIHHMSVNSDSKPDQTMGKPVLASYHRTRFVIMEHAAHAPAFQEH